MPSPRTRTRPDPAPDLAGGPVELELPVLAEQAAWVATEARLFADEDATFRATVTPGDPNLVLVVGENASGKSLFFRVLCAKIAQSKTVPVTLSIRERTGSGMGEMARMRQAFMFGEESEKSTGATSVQVIQAAFTRNLDRPTGTVLALDEPELGLSDGYAGALGRYIGQQSAAVPATCAGVVVVTHSRSLVTGLLRGYGADPTFVQLHADGAAPPGGGLAQWLAAEEERSVDDLLALPAVGLQRWRATEELLRESRQR